MLVSDDDKAQLQHSLKDGPLARLLEQVEVEAKAAMQSVIGKNLDDPIELAAAKRAQAQVQGYLLCIDRMKEILS